MARLYRPQSARRLRNPRMSTVPELTPVQARARIAHGALLIDVREAHERASGMAEGALGIAKGDLLAAPATHLPATDREVVLICQSGKRSMDAALALLDQGYTHVASVHGGTTAWRADGLPLVQPLQSDADARFQRTLCAPPAAAAGGRGRSAGTAGCARADGRCRRPRCAGRVSISPRPG